MFDITFFADPRRLRRDFLAADDVVPQTMPPELAAEFDKVGDKHADVRMTGHFWRDFCYTYRGHLGLLFAGRAVNTVMILVAVLVSERLLDPSTTLQTAFGLLAIYAVSQFAQRVLGAWTALLQSQLLVFTRTFVTLRLNTKLLRMGQIDSAEFSTGNLNTLISSDIYRIAELMMSIARNGVPCALGIVLLGPVIWGYMGIPGLVAIAVSFAALPLGYVFGRYVFKKEDLIKTEEDRLSTVIGEWVSNARLLRFLNWEGLMRTKVAGHVRTLVLEATKQHGVNLVNFGISVTWWLVPIIALLWTVEVMGVETDLVRLFASVWMLNHITLYIRFLPDIFISWSAAAACVRRLDRLFSAPEIADSQLEDARLPVADLRPVRLHLQDVGYAYGDGPEVLSNLDLTIDLEEHLALIGKVGAGKSTLLKLLTAELAPTRGRILVEFDDGSTADLWRRNVYERVREVTGYMPQEAYLSNTTLAINVALSEHHDTHDLMTSLRFAELEADVSAFESGIAEEVGETGVNLSGGQKQRVNLARALHSGRPFLVLDDPLSAVDTATETALMDTLLTRADGFVLSSHRLHELHRVDRLVGVDGGRVVEDGSPQALAEQTTSLFSQYLLAAEDDHDD